MPRWMGQREYARHRKVALRAVQKAIDDKRIKYVEVPGYKYPQIDADQADVDWDNNTDPLKQSFAPSTAFLPPGPTPPPESEYDAELKNDEFRKARAEQIRITTKKASLELAVMEGKFVAVEDAARAASTYFRGLRDGVLNVPARIRSALNLSHEQEQTLVAELEQALGSFDRAQALFDAQDLEDEETPA